MARLPRKAQRLVPWSRGRVVVNLDYTDLVWARSPGSQTVRVTVDYAPQRHLIPHDVARALLQEALDHEDTPEGCVVRMANDLDELASPTSVSVSATFIMSACGTTTATASKGADA